MGSKNRPPSEEADHEQQFAPPPPPANADYRHARFPRFTSLPRHTGRREKAAANLQARPRISVVGVCSSGKSTLVSALKSAGYNARAVSQEHSYVPHLWQLSNPDVLIYLDAALPTIRRRRRAHWPQEMLDEEHRRLTHAREHADLYIPTDGLAPEDVASRAVSFLNMQAAHEGPQNRPSGGPPSPGPDPHEQSRP